jgi:acyl-homoserine lactone acylase PvdQ
LEHSNSIQDAENALQHYGHPPQNFVIADHSGNVFQATCGFFGSTSPIFPTPWIKAQTVLKEKNPERGFVFSANQAQSNHSSIHGLSNSFAPEARAKGIKNGLGQASLSPQNLIALQTKTVDEEWGDFKIRFLSKIPRSYHDLKKEMANWDGEMIESSVPAAFFSVVRSFLHRELIATCLGDVPFAPHSDRLNAILLQNEWITGKKQQESVSKIWEKSMILGIDSLIRLNGKNWRNWTYGKIHQAEVQHITKIPALGAGKWTFNGSPRSVNVLRIGKGIHGASMRNTVIFTPKGFIRYSINFGGQSGRFFSPHYSDQIQPWRDGLYRKQISSTFKSRMVYEFLP